MRWRWPRGGGASSRWWPRPGPARRRPSSKFVASRPGPHAWLSLGEADGSPGRFATYLAAAVAAIDPAPRSGPNGCSGAGSPADCAAMLAEALPAGSTTRRPGAAGRRDRPHAAHFLASTALRSCSLFIVEPHLVGLAPRP